MLRTPSQAIEQEPMPEVPVNGRVLKWARDIRGLSLEAAALRLSISPEELRKYETGAKLPMIGFLREMASKYQINFASLLMPEPLPIEKRLTDHRVRHGRAPLTLESIVAMEDISEALDAFADIAAESSRLVPKLNIGTATLEENPEFVAQRERKRFNVSIQEQQSWRDTYTARNRWRQRIEDRGIFTYLIKLQAPEELSGFSLYKPDNLGAICVNDREVNDGAKIFTLFHEYCHLVLRQGGISDENNADRVEQFCNRFASAFLIPRNYLVDFLPKDIEIPYEFSDRDVKNLARSFRVSNRAMAYRLEQAELAPDGFYARKTAPWDVPVEKPAPSKPEKLNHIVIQLKRIGKLHAFTVLQAERKHLINPFEAAELVGVQFASFPKLAKAIG